MIDIRILGPLEAYLDGRPVPTGPPQQRALLGLLALRSGQIVSVDFIIDALWGSEPPSTATNIIQGYVARLRAALEPERPSGQPPAVLVTQSPGYVLNLPPGGTDASRFAQLLDDARKLRERDPQTTAGILREALALWRGDVPTWAILPRSFRPERTSPSFVGRRSTNGSTRISRRAKAPL